ncbi:MAG: hypothetical protein Q9163_003926 [Psora crenata]
MRTSIATLAIAVFAGVALANSGCKQKPNTSLNPSGNSINTPGLASQVPVGIPYDITWQPTTSGTVSIVLLRGPSENVAPLECIVDSVPNTGTYTWTPSTSLENDSSRYGIQIVVDGSGEYQYSTQFGISNLQNTALSSGEPTTTNTALSSGEPTTTTTVHQKNTLTVSNTVYRSTLSKLTAPTPSSNLTSSLTHYGTRTSLPSSVTSPSNVTSTHKVTPTKPITRPSSSGPMQTSVTIASAPMPTTPNTTATSSIIAATGAAVKVGAGGMLAGLGAAVALVL